MHTLRRLSIPAALLALCFLHAPTAAAQPASCLSEPTLEDLVDCAKDFIIDEETEAYDVPSNDVLDAFRGVVRAMLDGTCTAAALPADLSPHYTLAPFTDAGNGRTYCVLLETATAGGSVAQGWGTVIVDARPDARPFSIDVPHPLNDTATPEEGIAVFKGVGARSFLMAGAHRHANDAESPCDDDYDIADAAHNAQHTFFAAIEAMDAFDRERGRTPFLSFQFHGMGTSTCPGVDVYLTHGSNRPPEPNSVVDQLKRGLQDRFPASWGWTVTVPGDAPSCSKTGTSNVEGRLLNGIPAGAVCSQRAYQYTGRFIHIEQKRYVRADSVHGYWIDAINALDLTIVPDPPAYWLTSPDGGEAWDLGSTETITWTSTNVSDDVHLALFKDGDYHKRITSSTANDGSYDWYVPPTLGEGATYTVRIMSTEDDELRDYSNGSFTIRVGPESQLFTLESPNGGERWERGKTYEIAWASQNIAENVHLAVYRNGSYYKRITSSTPNDGSYPWKVPTSYPAGDRYAIRVMSTENDDLRDLSDAEFSITAGQAATVAVEGDGTHPDRLVVHGNHPNPFNPETTIRYTLPAAADVEVAVYDLLGRRVALLVDGRQAAGPHDVRFDAAHLASGLYLYRIQAGGTAETRRMLLLK